MNENAITFVVTQTFFVRSQRSKREEERNRSASCSTATSPEWKIRQRVSGKKYRLGFLLSRLVSESVFINDIQMRSNVKTIDQRRFVVAPRSSAKRSNRRGKAFRFVSSRLTTSFRPPRRWPDLNESSPVDPKSAGIPPDRVSKSKDEPSR